MKIPDEFVGRVIKTNLTGLGSSFRKLDEIRKEWQGSEIDVVYENGSPIVVIVFESTVDCLAFKLRYGEGYAKDSI